MYGTSYHALVDRAALQPGETLLVLGAAGGVGLTAVELGAVMGATVIAAGVDRVRQLRGFAAAHGVAMTINYAEEDLKARVRELTGGAGADVVYDAVGGGFSEPALRSMAWGGRFLVIGFASGEIPKISLNLPLLKGCSVVGVFWGSFAQRQPEASAANIAALVDMWKAGRIRPTCRPPSRSIGGRGHPAPGRSQGRRPGRRHRRTILSQPALAATSAPPAGSNQP